MLLWLLRESSCIYDFFSKEERKRVGQRMAELHRANRLAKMLFAVDIHSSLEIAVKNFLRSKKEVMETPDRHRARLCVPVFGALAVGLHRHRGVV